MKGRGVEEQRMKPLDPRSMLGLVKRVRVGSLGMVWSEVTLGSGCLMDPTYLPYGLDWISLTHLIWVQLTSIVVVIRTARTAAAGLGLAWAT